MNDARHASLNVDPMDPLMTSHALRRRAARAAGWLYLSMAVFSAFSMIFVTPKFVVPGDAAATAGRILASERLLRVGFASNLAGQVLFLFLAYALYKLFRPVDKDQARIMVMLVVASVPVTFVSMLGQLAPVFLLKGNGFLSAFDPAQRQALAMASLGLHDQGILLAGIFWGLWLLPLGILAFKSGFIPKAFGVLLWAGCFGYLLDSLAAFVFPGQRAALAPVVTVSEFISEIPFILWLLVKGVRAAEPAAAVEGRS